MNKELKPNSQSVDDTTIILDEPETAFEMNNIHNRQSRNAVIDEVEKLLIAELLIAQKEGQPTSRLTSLAVGINALKEGKEINK